MPSGGVVQGKDFPSRTHVFMASTANQKFRQTTNTSSDGFMQLESRWLYDDECTAVLEKISFSIMRRKETSLEPEILMEVL